MLSIFIAQKDIDSLERITALPIWTVQNDLITVDTATDGHTSIALLIKNHYDLVILDIHLPDIDVFTLLTYFNESGSTMPFVITSTDPNHSYTRQALHSRAADYLLTPITNEIMEDVLTRVTARSSAADFHLSKTLTNTPDIYVHIANRDNGMISMIKTYSSRFMSSPSIKFDSALTIIQAITDSSIDWFFEQLPYLKKFISIKNSVTFKKLLTQYELETTLPFGMYQLSALQDFILILHPCTSDPLFNSIFDYILQNIDCDISQKSIAKQFYQTNSAFSKIFYEKTNIYFSHYISEVKLLRAEYLLLNTNLKVYEIGNMIGYRDYNHFLKIFKNKYDQSPTDFRLTNI